MNKTLLIFTDGFPYGGADPFLANEMPYLEASFRNITIVPLEKGKTGIMRTIPADIKVLEPPFIRFSSKLQLLAKGLFNRSPVIPFISEGRRSHVFTNASRFRNWITHFLVTRRMLSMDYLKNNSFLGEYDIIYFYWGLRWSQVLPFLSPGLKPKIVVRFHGSDLYEHTNDNYIPWRREQLDNTGSAVVISDAGYRYFNEKYPFFSGKIFLSRIGTSDHGINPYIRSGTVRIVSCSNIYPVKRVDLVARALSFLKMQAEWIHFGEGSSRREVEKQISRMPANIRCTLAGNIPNEELMRYYSNNPVDLFINLSSSEGVPVSVMEAMSFGIPVVATDVGGTGEIVSEKTGCLINPGLDAETISKIITTLLEREDYPAVRERSREQWIDKSKADSVYPPFIIFLSSL